MELISLTALASAPPPNAAGGQHAGAHLPVVAFSLGCGEGVERSGALRHPAGEDEPEGRDWPSPFVGSSVPLPAFPSAPAELAVIRTAFPDSADRDPAEKGAKATEPPQRKAAAVSARAPAPTPAIPFTVFSGTPETATASSSGLMTESSHSLKAGPAEPPSTADGAAAPAGAPSTGKPAPSSQSSAPMAVAELPVPPEPRQDAAPALRGGFVRTGSDAVTMQQLPAPIFGTATPPTDRLSQRDATLTLPKVASEQSETVPPEAPGAAPAAPATPAGPRGNPAPVPSGGLPLPGGQIVGVPQALAEAAPQHGPDSAPLEPAAARPDRGFGLSEKVAPDDGLQAAGTATRPEERAETTKPSLPAGDVPGHLFPGHADTTLRAEGPTTARADIPAPPPVARQIAEAFAAFPDRAVEITLSPEELGRVRMVVTSHDGALVLSLAAERAETLDLMRRNIDQLAADLHDLGFDSFRFNFAGEGSGGHDARPAPGAEALPDGPVPVPPAPTAHPAGRASAGAGLDIRL
jgi:hypothetical protein